MANFFSTLTAGSHRFPTKLVTCIQEVVDELQNSATSFEHPGMLLGKIQSGKTNGFLGIIAESFDRGYDITLVLTKGTKPLAQQTVQRISAEFKSLIDNEEVIVFDIMNYSSLTRPDKKKKIIIIAKKEIKNLERVEAFFIDNREMQDKTILLVDDEADMASIRFAKKRATDEYEQGAIAQKMDSLRRIVPNISFLQVTATPYALYLQPEDYDPALYLPKRPRFTKVLPTHSAYVGGDDYFGAHTANDYRNKLYIEVPHDEQNSLRVRYSSAVEIEDVWTTPNISTLRKAVFTFLLGATIRKMQDIATVPKPKFSMIIHNDTQRASHKLQETTVKNIISAFETGLKNNSSETTALFNECFDDLAESVLLQSGTKISKTKTLNSFKLDIIEGDNIVQVVNSDAQVATLLDPITAELKLRTLANIFIGGSLLDRGITIPALLSFFYGRNPAQMQADTVLQHSRMYGARPKPDLAVTRFFTSNNIHKRLKLINEADNKLRDTIENDQNASVIFIESDRRRGVIPCSPSKIAVSEVVTLGAVDYFSPTGFDTKPANSALSALNAKLLKYDNGELTSIPIKDAIEIIDLAKRAFILDKQNTFRWEALTDLINYFSKNGKIKLFVRTNRKVNRRSADKSGKSIVGGKEIRDKLAVPRSEPALVIVRQEPGDWSGLTQFWWPVLVTPTDSKTCLYAQR